MREGGTEGQRGERIERGLKGIFRVREIFAS